MELFHFFVGLSLLGFGRKLFWLFVGCAGFAAGFTIVPQIWRIPSEVIILVVSIGAGIIGALLAIFFQRVAVGLGGFAAGGYIAMSLLNGFGVQTNQMVWIVLFGSGIIGALLLFVIFDRALIVLSSISGASLLAQAVQLHPTVEWVSFFMLLVIGVAFQSMWLRKDRQAARVSERRGNV